MNLERKALIYDIRTKLFLTKTESDYHILFAYKNQFIKIKSKTSYSDLCNRIEAYFRNAKKFSKLQRMYFKLAKNKLSDYI